MGAGTAIPWAARLHGALDGQAVQATLGDRGARVEARLGAPLDLGLQVRTKTLNPVGLFSRPVLLGDSSWDGEVLATADEPERARLFLVAPLTRAILDLNASATGIEIDDGAVASRYPPPDAPGLVDQLRRVALVAAEMDARRPTLPPAGPLAAHARALGALEGSGCVVSRSPLGLRGKVGATHVDARFRRMAAGRFSFELHVTPLEPGPDCGLLVSPTSLGDRAAVLLGGEDIRTGEPRFDRAFRVRCLDEARARGLVDAETRELLFELASLSDELALTERSILLRGEVSRLPAERVVTLIHAAATACERAARSAPRAAEGPYR